MANEFSKEERVAFEQLLEGFDDAQVMARNVRIYNTDQQAMERSGDVIWRPMPYIARSFTGLDQSANFFDKNQLSVPATIGFVQSVPWKVTVRELRDALQEDRLGEAAKLKLASDINVATLNVAALQGSLVVKQTTAAAGFADVALCEAIMNEQGVPMGDRYLALSTRDYNGMAGALSALAMPGTKPQTAYERAYIGRIASFEAYKLDYATRKVLAGGGAGLTISTLAAGGNVFVPAARTVATTGETANRDNRFQQVTISSTTSVAAGDAFTIAAVNAVNHITKQDTGQLKTFRVISVDSATTMTICPPLITGQGGTEAELQYQNCVVNTAAANSAIVFLNTATAAMNPFWHKDSIEILPGRLAFDASTGLAVMRGTTDQGIELTMTKQADIKTGEVLYRLDTMFGVVSLNPEMSRIIMFSQP